jgi:ABC-type amino acid transport substrate-binding protein
MRKSRIIPHRGTMSSADWCRRFAALPLLFALSFLFLLFPAAVNAATADGSGVEAGEVREVIAAIPRHFPPLVDVDEAGEPVGLAIDMLNEITRRARLAQRRARRG